MGFKTTNYVLQSRAGKIVNNEIELSKLELKTICNIIEEFGETEVSEKLRKVL